MISSLMGEDALSHCPSSYIVFESQLISQLLCLRVKLHSNCVQSVSCERHVKQLLTCFLTLLCNLHFLQQVGDMFWKSYVVISYNWH